MLDKLKAERERSITIDIALWIQLGRAGIGVGGADLAQAARGEAGSGAGDVDPARATAVVLEKLHLLAAECSRIKVAPGGRSGAEEVRI